MTERPDAQITDEVEPEMPERFDLRSVLPTDDRYEAIREAFPEVFREDKIDFDALKSSLGEWVDPGQERFGLTWPAKAECMRIIQEPSIGTLVPMPEESVDWENAQNVIIEGENLEVVKLLQKAYYGKVKLIYIDPPYNTGKEFIYPDNFREGLTDYLRYSGQVDEEGFRTSANAETAGRYHSKWLSMMYPRLFLARSLLKQDGFILVSIDDHEVNNLRLLMNEIFGEENFVATMVWQGGRKNDSKLVSSGHDYIVIFARDLQLLKKLDLHWEERKEGLSEVYEAVEAIRSEVGEDYEEGHQRLLAWYRELPQGHLSKAHDHFSYIDARGVYYPDNLRSPNPRPNLVYEYKGYQPHPNGWAYARDRMEELDAEDRLYYPARQDQRLKIKSYLHEHETWAPGSVFYQDRRGARKVVEKLLGVSAKGLFDFPKDHTVLGRLIATMTSNDDLIADFFAGSGSTAHAVMNENRRDGAIRRFLLVQLPEPVENEQYPTIADITRARVAAATTELQADDADQDVMNDSLGFRSYQLSTSNFQIWDGAADRDVATQLEIATEHLAADAATSAVLTELLLKAGFDLVTPVEEVEVANRRVYSIADGQLMVYIESDLTLEVVEGIVESDPSLIIVADSAFGDDDELKVNALQTVRSRNLSSGSDITLKVV